MVACIVFSLYSFSDIRCRKAYFRICSDEAGNLVATECPSHHPK